jgi:hypothetical protein
MRGRWADTLSLGPELSTNLPSGIPGGRGIDGRTGLYRRIAPALGRSTELAVANFICGYAPRRASALTMVGRLQTGDGRWFAIEQKVAIR